MSNVVVFGGSFNPPTKAHMLIALKAVDLINADKLCFVPVGDKYVKESLISSNYRVEMLNILKNNNSSYDIDIDLTEVNSEKNLNTIDTLRILQNKYKGSTLYFFVVSDNILHLPEWKEADELLKKYKILTIRRDGYNIKDIINNKPLLNKYKENIVPIEIKESIFISSTMVRELIKNNNEDLEYYLDDNIKEYIKENQLY